MSRRLISGVPALAALLLLTAASASAGDDGPPAASAPSDDPLAPVAAPLDDGPSPSTSSAETPEDREASPTSLWTEQGIGVAAGAAFGGLLTPGGLRLTGTYLYRLSQSDWFDGAAAFTLGSGAAACFRDRQDVRVCDHGAVDGFAVDFVAAVRRSWTTNKKFTPFARLGVGLRLARFSGDQVAGLAVPLIGGGGVTADLSPSMRLVAAGQLELGGGLFSRGLGTAPQLGLSISFGVEFALR